jgi:hypothetical protein
MTEVRTDGSKGHVMAPDHTPELTIDLDNPPEASGRGHPDRGRLLRPSTRQTVATAGLTAIAALFVGYAIGDARPAPNRPQQAPVTPVAASDTPRPHARLVAPATATAGEPIAVLAFRNPQLCGPTELRLDDAPVKQQIIGYAAQEFDRYPQVVMSMDVPPSTKAGTHKITLLGPVPSTHGAICADTPERQGRIATTTISIGVK